MPKEKIDGNDVCAMMHTALRKCCDSKPTSVAYNLVHVICDQHVVPHSADPWRLFGALVAESWNAGSSPLNAIEWAMDRFEDRFFRYDEPGWTLPDGSRCLFYALQCTFELFDARDWGGMAAYLED